MKKKFKTKILMVLAIIISYFSTATLVFAAGSATVGFQGNSTVKVGSQITIKMQVSNVSGTNGGITSLGGYLVFDDAYLEYISGTGATTPYAFQINEDNYKIAGLDLSMSNGINTISPTTVFTFVFKAKKTGTTQVSLRNAEVTDANSQFTPTVSAKSITITDNTTSPTNPTNPTNPTTPSKSSDATLKELAASGYTLSPNFQSNVTSYTVTVPKDATKVTLTGKVNESHAKVSGLGDITLTGDRTIANIKVTAEDGTTKTYVVNIVKENDEAPKKDSDATLKSLDISGFTLNPTFKKDITNYSIKVKNNITGLNVTAIPNSSKAKVEITGNKGWKEGMNQVNIKVTAEDGTINIYTINVERAASGTTKPADTNKKSSDNYLSDIVINSSHEISPKFNKDISTYNITVPYEVNHLDLSPILNNSKSKFTITGNKDFKVGKVNIVTIEVTAEDGSKRFYTLNVTRSTKSSDNDLGDLEIDTGLSPEFDPDHFEYDTEVDADDDSIKIIAKPSNPDSKVEIIGNENLKEGNNTILIKVTDKNGFSKYYQINAHKKAKENKIFGLSPLQFGVVSGIIGLLLLLLLLLLFRKKKEEERNLPTQTPIIDFKPEFNFGSRNGTDDDIVYPNASLNQSSNNETEYKRAHKDDVKELNYQSKEEVQEIPYDMYDEIVTKDELIDAIQEGLETKNPEKLRMLLEQEQLNRKKEEMRRKEEENER